MEVCGVRSAGVAGGSCDDEESPLTTPVRELTDLAAEGVPFVAGI
jgi:hypothetical protein